MSINFNIILYKELFKVFNTFLKYCNLLVPIIRDELKVLYSVIRSIVVFVMYKFPSVKIATKMFCHYKAVFQNSAIGSCHWIKEIIWRNIYHNVMIPLYPPSPFPCNTIYTTSCLDIYIVTTPDAARIFGRTFYQRNPSFFSTVNTGVPNHFANMFTMFICNIANLVRICSRHTNSIPQYLGGCN